MIPIPADVLAAVRRIALEIPFTVDDALLLLAAIQTVNEWPEEA